MNIQEMKQRTAELELLERQQMNGAVIEWIDDDMWIDFPDVELISNIQYRIQPPPEQPGYEWCGYDVPTEDNCDAFFPAEGTAIVTVTAGEWVSMNHNNGYRHLLRRVDPEMMICDHARSFCSQGCEHHGKHKRIGACQRFTCAYADGGFVECIPYVEPTELKTIPYTLDTFVLKSSHVRNPTTGRLYTFNATNDGIETISGKLSLAEHVQWYQALSSFTWPDGSLFGVEVTE